MVCNDRPTWYYKIRVEYINIIKTYKNLCQKKINVKRVDIHTQTMMEHVPVDAKMEKSSRGSV